MSYLLSEEVALRLRVKPQTLALWRLKGKGPRWLKLGRSVRYEQADVERWLAEEAEQGVLCMSDGV